MTRILVAALALAGCYRPTVASCQYECAASGTPCPSGLQCLANMCVHPGEACSDGGIVDAPGDGTNHSCPGFDFRSTSYAIDATVHGFVITDWNGDGPLDIVMAVSSAATHEMGHLLGNGSGGFAVFAAQNLSPNISPEHIATFRRAENLAAFVDSTSNVWTLDSPNTLTSLVQVAATGVAIASGNVTSDAIPDLVVASDTGSFTLLVGNSGGFAVGVTTPVDPSPLAIAVADLDADGNGDVVVAGTTSVEVVHSNGDGSFATPMGVLSGSFAAVAIDDVDGDKVPDIVVAGGTTLHALHNAGGLAFSGDATTQIDPGPSGVALGDLDGDGVLDAVVATTQSVTVLLGRGDGRFTLFKKYGAFAASGAAIADVDGNGRPDIVTMDAAGNHAYVLLNTCATR
jgi:hypothetical protein